ncbi:hypothetical protein [Hwangdonia lutea]|uniref:Outer membrane protein beta-barrel domain-containing protein n=1 Tax=Hwangdonia lutea TaxID=3075823 RepID=A0AA97HR03_9FLAO|nr:hypothetical protein [Hwangdonia sp. SCSIO 19198]WOD43288.1 hypothetical protein RNZ46_14960 [Hwangdonia sp. SCSIO 19198]
MKNIKLTLTAISLCFIALVNAQESKDYIEFNDRKNTVHGVYLGIATHYGEIDKVDTYAASFKVAYVANQKFEIGFVGVGFYSDFNLQGLSYNNRDLVGAYGGLHLEPILFSKSKLNLSFPLLIGGGAVGLLKGDINDTYIEDSDWEAVFVVEPGISILYNISRYLQLEAGVKHRFSSRLNLQSEYNVSRIDGYSVGIGIKVGVFNMGRNRYKKN